MAPILEKIQDDNKKVKIQEDKKKLKIVKDGTVSKIKTEIRTKDPMLFKKEDIKMTTKTVKRNFQLNKLSQMRKIVFKNKKVAPENVKHHANSVVARYSPAVFLNTIVPITNKMMEGEEYKTDKLNLKVVKTRAAVDQSGSKLDKLISFQMSSKNSGVSISQQVHVFNTTQSLMIQGSRLLNGVKGFKLFLEDFLQPLLEDEIAKKDIVIAMTEDLLDHVNIKFKPDEKEKNDTDTPKSDLFSIELPEKHEDWYHCKQCEVKFRVKQGLESHVEKIHREKIDVCNICEKSFNNKNKSESNVCNECEKKFGYKTHIKDPIEKHHNEIKPILEAGQDDKKEPEDERKSLEKEKQPNEKKIHNISPSSSPPRSAKKKKTDNETVSELEEDLKLVRDEVRQLKVINKTLNDEKEKLGERNET